MITVIANLKGGSGKSTVAFNLGVWLEKNGKSVVGAYKKNKHPFHPGPAAAPTANDPPGNRSIAPNGPVFHSRRCKHAHFFSTLGSIPAIRHDESLPRRCERRI